MILYSSVADMDELSEGEIEDSSSSPEHPHDGDDSPPVAKKKKTFSMDYSEPGLYGNTGASGMSSISKKQRKKQRKNELRRLQQERKLQESKARTSVGAEPLTVQQLNTLKGLVALTQGQSVAMGMQKLKTADFQTLISHIVCDPAVVQDLPGDDELKKHRVVVLWMAMIPEEVFTNSEQHFPKLKSLSPSLKFKLEHPGSARFVKLGLESFFCSSITNEPTKPKFPLSSPKLSRSAYVLTKEELAGHGFPVPGMTEPTDTSDYTTVTSWPDKEPQTVLKEMQDVRMFAIDCEMVETEPQKSELARVSVVDEALNCIYDTLVKPDKPVTDYRTKFSGIDHDMLKDVTVNLSEVQQKISELVPPGSILIGHSLDNDFHALKFSHPFVIDTSCVFTPTATPMNKPGLRRLAKELLSMDIQQGTGTCGHNSIEDASTCMRLVQHKIHSGPNCTIPFNQGAHSVLTEYRTHGKSTGIVDRRGVVTFYGRGASFSCDIETDAECVEKSLEIIPQCDFTFLQLHEMELFFKGNKTHTTVQSVVDAMDDNILCLVEGCPEGTLLFVVCGSGDIREVRKLQQDDFADPIQLKKAVMIARTGLVITCMIS